MNFGSIFLMIVIIVILYYLTKYIFNDTHTLTSSVASGTTMQTISPSNLSTDSSGLNTSNFTYSIWFFVEDWNYKYGEPKIIYGRMGDTTQANSGTLIGISGSNPCPVVFLGAIDNNLNISLTVNPDSDSIPESSDIRNADGTVVHTCMIPNIPIQKWVNLLVSVYGKTVDTYIDGKLVKTCVIPGIAKINNSSNVYVTPSGGFSGWTSKFQYFPKATDPQSAWDIYKKGYNSGLSSFFGNYQVKVSFINNGNETNSLTI
jgi:hypothetical protein